MKREKEEHSRQLRPLLPVRTGKLCDALRTVKVSSKKGQPDPATGRDGAHQKKTTEATSHLIDVSCKPPLFPKGD
jgi:hypothetical protein